MLNFLLYSFNTFLVKVIQPETAGEWERYWKDYPLTFLLYHDFIQRYPDYENISLVKDDLQNAIKADLDLIKNTVAKDSTAKEEKMGLMVKIKHFVEKNYPDLSINDNILSADVSS